MFPPYFFLMFLVLTFGYALWRGRSDEKIAATVTLVATIATRVAVSPQTVRYAGVETGLLVIDAAVLLAFVAIALRSPRFWPLWAAGLQLTSSMAHLMKALDADLPPRAYGAAAVFWAYPILLVIVIGTWRTHRRNRRQAAVAA